MKSLPNQVFDSLARQDYLEHDTVEDALHSSNKYNLWQVKFDGIWGKCLVTPSETHYPVYSRTGSLKTVLTPKQSLICLSDTIILIGELMYGSQWSQDESRVGKFFVFDSLPATSSGRSLPYDLRWKMAKQVVDMLGEPFVMVENYHLQTLGSFLIKHEQSGKYEGVILRAREDLWTDKVGKLKFSLEDDFVILGYTEGEGRLAGSLGSLKLGQFDENGICRELLQCGGGFTDEQRKAIWEHREQNMFAVVTISGKSRFTSGALRHPNFVRFHPDKSPVQCKIKSTSQ